MNATLARLWQHLRTGDRALYRALPADRLQALGERVTESEQHHSGEILLAVEASLPWTEVLHGATARERALALFSQLGVWDTAHNNGVLIYLLLADRAIEIVADRGLNSRVAREDWQRIASELAVALNSVGFEAGLRQALEAVSALLQLHFSVSPEPINPNELPDSPFVG